MSDQIFLTGIAGFGCLADARALAAERIGNPA